MGFLGGLPVHAERISDGRRGLSAPPQNTTASGSSALGQKPPPRDRRAAGEDRGEKVTLPRRAPAITDAKPHLRVSDRLWHALGCQLRNPSGAAGSIVGWLMAWINGEPNRLAIDALDPGPGETGLALGFGPRCGLRSIAARARGARVYGVDQS